MQFILYPSMDLNSSSIDFSTPLKGLPEVCHSFYQVFGTMAATSSQLFWLFILAIFSLQTFTIPNTFSNKTVLARQPGDTDVAPLAKKANPEAIAKAREIVKVAIAEVSISNKARLDNPFRNQYALKAGTGRDLSIQPVLYRIPGSTAAGRTSVYTGLAVGGV
jgi:hypothetical protein